MSNTIKKDINSSLKFVYSENNSISVIFHENDLLMGVVGEFNQNLKELEKIYKREEVLDLVKEQRGEGTLILRLQILCGEVQ